MIGSSSSDVYSDVKLIDFGMAKKYLDKFENHVKCEDLPFFEGNKVFASHNALSLKTTSRKDDLISLSYLIIYLIDGALPFIKTLMKYNNHVI